MVINIVKQEDNFIIIGENKIETLLAISLQEQERGLMGKKFPPPVMTFVYGRPSINKFWMKNTPSPLDIVFSFKGKITEICKGVPFSTSLIGSDLASDLVIEFPAGTCNKLGIKIGDPVKLQCNQASAMKIFAVQNGLY